MSQFTQNLVPGLTSRTVKGMFCRSKTHDVSLLCICCCPWIEGTTSRAIYGDRQKEFNVHNCVKCLNWFHTYCLKLCNIKPATKRQDFICPSCVMPRTIPWKHHKYINTCTSDNIVNMLLLHCQQNPHFLNNFGSSYIETALKSGISLMLNDDISLGKEVILDAIHSRTNQDSNGGIIDCIGSEYRQFVQHLRGVWKIFLSLRCHSIYCPRPVTERYQSSFSLVPVSVKPICAQINSLFSKIGDESGYCGQKFYNDPPDEQGFSCLKERTLSSGLEFYFECTGSVKVINSQFLSKTPWILPFQIDSFGPTDLKCIKTTIPETISVYSKVYKLAGYTMIKDKHLTSVVLWKNKMLLYDGLGETNEVRLREVRDFDFADQRGSYIYFFLL